MKRMHKKLPAAMLATVMLFAAFFGGAVAAAAENDETGLDAAVVAAGSESLVDRTGIADRIIFSAFFPPCREDIGWGPMTFQQGSEIDDYHYRMMAECGVNFIENVWSCQMQTRAQNLHIAELCDKYGMWLFVQEAWQWQ
ncbi:MAG: hypothetical protein FWF08_07700, partial [Oscillospiraceae bacterium]|nr:hypothetical protein [Oscillospiraceae bacterium]